MSQIQDLSAQGVRRHHNEHAPVIRVPRSKAMRTFHYLVMDPRVIQPKDVDEVLGILSPSPGGIVPLTWTDLLLFPAAIFLRMSKPLANGVALAGRSSYPFIPATVQCVGLSLTSLVFATCSFYTFFVRQVMYESRPTIASRLSGGLSDWYAGKTGDDKRVMLYVFISGLIGGIGDICEMLACQFSGIGVVTVMIGAIRLVMTAAAEKIVLGKAIPESKVWSLAMVTLSTSAFGVTTSQVVEIRTAGEVTGYILMFVAAAALTVTSITKEWCSRSNVDSNVTYYESMAVLFCGVAASSFVVSLVQLKGSVRLFFDGWEIRSITIPVAIVLFATTSTEFTLRFGALLTTLVGSVSMVSTFLCCVLFFGQACTPQVIVLILLVITSVLTTARGKADIDEITKVNRKLKEGEEALRKLGAIDTKPYCAITEGRGSENVSARLHEPLL